MQERNIFNHIDFDHQKQKNINNNQKYQITQKRKSFVKNIRKDKRQQQFNYLRFKRDNQYLLDLISSLLQNSQNIQCIVKYKQTELKTKNQKDLARMLKQWFFNNKSFVQNFHLNQSPSQPTFMIHSLPKLISWVNVIQIIIQNFPQQVNQVLQISFLSLVQISNKLRNFEPLFILFKALAIKIQYFPQQQLVILHDYKWNKQNNDKLSKFYSKNQTFLLFQLIKSFPQKSFQTFVSKDFVIQMASIIKNSYYEEQTRICFFDILTQITFYDKQNKYAQIIINQTVFLMQCTFIISFSKSTELVQGCCSLIRNIIFQCGLKKIRQSIFVNNLIEAIQKDQINQKRNFKIQLQLRNLFFFLVLSLQSQQDFDYFNSLKGCQTISILLHQFEYMENQQFITGIVLSIQFLIGHGENYLESNQNRYINIYKRQFECLNIKENLERFEKGRQLIERWWSQNQFF